MYIVGKWKQGPFLHGATEHSASYGRRRASVSASWTVRLDRAERYSSIEQARAQIKRLRIAARVYQVAAAVADSERVSNG